jgi:SAM-dependent methyltransferase
VPKRAESYAPGWGADAVAMMASRSAEGRAAFVLPDLAAGMRVVDVGCGPGTVSIGLARVVAPGSVLGIDTEPSQIAAAISSAQRAGIRTIRFEAGNAYDLPIGDGEVDVYFSHALFEHLAEPRRALAEAHRVLQIGGTLAIAASDWSRAQLNPATADVATALNGHFALRHRAGGDPFAGGQLASRVRAAGFAEVGETSALREDLPYQDLARYVLARLSEALADTPSDGELLRACAAAGRWSETEGTAVQCWTYVTAKRVA